jgi:uncharacterized membrane protein YhiD involved in acid resistance
MISERLMSLTNAIHGANIPTLIVRVLVAFALTYVLGFERELRGSAAGDRTFSLVGVASSVPARWPGRARRT